MKFGHKEEETAATHLEHAIDDLKEARSAAEEELRSAIDTAIDRAVEALEQVTSSVEERAQQLKDRVGGS